MAGRFDGKADERSKRQAGSSAALAVLMALLALSGLVEFGHWMADRSIGEYSIQQTELRVMGFPEDVLIVDYAPAIEPAPSRHSDIGNIGVVDKVIDYPKHPIALMRMDSGTGAFGFGGGQVEDEIVGEGVRTYRGLNSSSHIMRSGLACIDDIWSGLKLESSSAVLSGCLSNIDTEVCAHLSLREVFLQNHKFLLGRNSFQADIRTSANRGGGALHGVGGTPSLHNGGVHLVGLSFPRSLSVASEHVRDIPQAASGQEKKERAPSNREFREGGLTVKVVVPLLVWIALMALAGWCLYLSLVVGGPWSIVRFAGGLGCGLGSIAVALSYLI